MKLYICGSRRHNNCFKIITDLKNNDDYIVSLKEKEIKYCTGCNSCIKKLDNYCVLNDDMAEIYSQLLKTNDIIIITPIYFNHITGLLKNVIDRLVPFSNHNLLKGKRISLVTVGALSENENVLVVDNIKNYFMELAEIFEFNFHFLKNLTSEINDDIAKNYENYYEVINELKSKIDSIEKAA